MNLTGTLSDWTVADLLNVMKVTGKTATLHIKGTTSGTIHFVEGRVVGAELDGRPIAGDSRADAADSLLVLWSIEEGTFEVVDFSGPDEPGWDVESVLADMEALRALESDLVQAGFAEGSLMLKEEIDAAVTIDPSDWWALSSLVSALSFRQLEQVFGRGRAIRLLHTLHRLGLIRKVDLPEEPAETPVEEPAPAEPPAVDLAALVADESAQFEGPAAAADRNEESWLDEIAAAAEAPASEGSGSESGSRRVLGVAAPASTVLTGSVLDEMRRLRVRPVSD